MNKQQSPTNQQPDQIRVVVHKASGDAVPSLVIEAVNELPDFGIETCESDSMKLYRDNASAIAAAMLRCLPGGTIDRIVLVLLEHQASLIRVAYSFENSIGETK